jgi:hypothetical protein
MLLVLSGPPAECCGAPCSARWCVDAPRTREGIAAENCMVTRTSGLTARPLRIGPRPVYDLNDVVRAAVTVRFDRRIGQYLELDTPIHVPSVTGPNHRRPLYELLPNVRPIHPVPQAVGTRLELSFEITGRTNDPMSRPMVQDQETTVHVRIISPDVPPRCSRYVDGPLTREESKVSLFQSMGGTRNAYDFEREGFFTYHFTERELRILLEWSGTKDRRDAASIVRRLVAEKLDGSPRGRKARAALHELGFLNPFTDRLLTELPQSGRDQLKGIHFHYNGHMRREQFALFPILQALGLADGSASRSPYSGTYPMQSIMERQLDGGAFRPHERTALRLETHPHVGPSDHQTTSEWMKKCARAALAAGQTFVVDKGGGTLLEGEPEDGDLWRAAREGRIRFLVHNADDLASLEPYLDSIWAVDVAGSLLKGAEAAGIGDLYALIAAREARERWDRPLGELPQYVIGFGLLGRSTAESLAKLSLPDGASPAEIRAARKRITILETNPKRAEEARALGFSVHSEETAPPARGVVIVASSTTSIDANSAKRLPWDSLILPITSGGKGVDVSGLRAAGETNVPRTRDAAYGTQGGIPRTFEDLEIAIDGRKLFIPADGYPLNLLEDTGSERYAITPAAVVMGVMTAAEIDGPGLHAVDERRSGEILDLYRAGGLFEAERLGGTDPFEQAWVDQALLDLRRR